MVAISLQTLGHVLRLRQQLEEALEVATRCEALRSASSSQAHGPQMAAVLFLQVRAAVSASGVCWCVCACVCVYAHVCWCVCTCVCLRDLASHNSVPLA